jgi:hypothetical protein
VLGGLRAVVTVDQLADYVRLPLSSLDVALRNGPVAAGLLERMQQGTHIGYRHPDAAWTSLPSRLEAGPDAVDFARWYADWLETVDAERREAAKLTALTVAASAAAAGETQLASRIRGPYRRVGASAPAVAPSAQNSRESTSSNPRSTS